MSRQRAVNKGVKAAEVSNMQKSNGISGENQYPNSPANDKIKILYVIDSLCAYGGTEKHLLQIIQNIDRSKFECYLLAFESAPEILNEFESFGCKVLPYALKRFYNREALRLALNLYKFLKNKQIGVVQTFHFGADFFGFIVAIVANVPLIISSRRDLGTYRTGRYRIADIFINRFTPNFLSVCDNVTNSMVQQGVKREKINRIYNGLDYTNWDKGNSLNNGLLRKKLNISQSSFVVGNVSHFRPEKGHYVFFEAMKRLKYRIPNLKVIALGRSFDFNMDIINKDEILREIVIIDCVRDVKAYLSIIDVACLTPICNEGFSNAIMEEMAAGKPVVATDIGGNAEAVLDGETGYIIPANDVDALEEAILKLYNNPDLRKRMGRKGRKRVEDHFTLERMIQNIENYYIRHLQVN